MSQGFKPKRVDSVQPALFETERGEVHPKERERVLQMIAAGKSGSAVDIAKDIHKRRRSASSEALLLDAYGARLTSLVERHLDRDAKALMDLVRERYPSAGERLREWNAILAARNGDLGAMLEPLNDAGVSAEKQAAIHDTVRRNVLDLRALAGCAALPPGHPLRTAASALQQAFEAVTSGPVADEALALPEVSRHSPLAPWKMLVRAIAAFYRQDDALCERCVAAIAADSAAARLAPVLRALTHKTPGQTPAAIALIQQAGGNLDQLRAILKRLDAALDRRSQPAILQEIRNAVTACAQAEPGLLERLKQHISVRAMIAEAKAEKIQAAMVGPSLKNAYFWRLLARGWEAHKDSVSIASACAAWEEFRRHAIHEGWFDPTGPAAATLYLHMADVLQRVPPQELASIRARYERYYDGHASYYQGQPQVIRSLMPDRNIRRLYYLSPHEVLERACQADPCAENFQRWLRYTTETSPDTSDLVAERWSAARSNDIPPLLHLMQSAETRNALQKAFKYMERAEQIDGLNADVRRARLRLLVAMAMRHLRNKKPRLAEKELAQMDALPQAQQGDRPAFVAALRWVCCILRNDEKEATAAREAAVRFLGDAMTTHALFLNVEHWCGLRQSPLGKPPRPTTPLFMVYGRVCALGEDMGLRIGMVQGMPEQLMRELSVPNISADPNVLAALGEAALRETEYPLAYVIAGAGLAQAADYRARFLFLRARSLPPWEEKRRSSCLAAASELARSHHDSELLGRIGDWRTGQMDWLAAPEAAAAAIGSEEIGRVVQREITERDFPRSAPPPPPDGDFDDDECQCPECRAARGELADVPPELAELVEELGPEAVAKALAEMLGMGGKKKRGRRRRYQDLYSDDTPF